MSFAATLINLEVITLSEVSQTKTSIISHIIWNLKKNIQMSISQA